MRMILNLFFGRKVKRETERYLRQLERLPTEASRRKAIEFLTSLRSQPGPKVTLGQTMWGQPVVVPLEDIVIGHGLATGGTGAGKTMAISILVEKLIEVATSR